MKAVSGILPAIYILGEGGEHISRISRQFLDKQTLPFVHQYLLHRANLPNIHENKYNPRSDVKLQLIIGKFCVLFVESIETCLKTCYSVEVVLK